MIMEKYTVEIREYERGWGSRVEEVKTFDTYDEAFEFCEEHNSVNNLPVTPDIYYVARIKN